MSPKTVTNVLFISPDFNYSCGVSKYVYLLLRELKKTNLFALFFITNSGDSSERLENIGIKPHIMIFRKGWKNIFYLIPNYFRLKNFCIKNKISIIHSNHRYPELLAYFVSKSVHIKTVTTVHSIVKRQRFLSFKSDLIIAVSRAVEQNIVNKFKIDPGKIKQYYNFIENQIENAETLKSNLHKLDLPPGSKLILHVGRWNRAKGSDILLRAFSILNKNYPNTYLVFLGRLDNPDEQKLLISTPNFLLIKPENEISAYYKICDLVVLPSREDSFPYVMLEAGLFKKPFIGGNTGGIAEFIEHEKNGLLVEPGDVKSLSEAIEWVLENPEDATQLGENLYQKVLTLNSKEEYIKKLTDIYYELLSS